MAHQILDRGQTFVAIRVPLAEAEGVHRDIAAQLRNREYMLMEVEDGDHLILIITLISTTPHGRRAFDRLVAQYRDTTSLQAVADNPALPTAEIDF